MNYLLLKSIFRKLIRNLSFSIIKILSLSIGLSCTIIIFLWIFSELKYDKSIKDSDNIYRLMSYGQEYWRNGVIWSPGPFVPKALESVPEIKNGLRISPTYSKIAFKYNDKMFYEENGVFVDTSFFSFFDFNLLLGDLNSCLTNPNSIILSETFAYRYFGNKNPIGELLETDDNQFIVSGVLKPIPENSSLKVNFILPIKSLEKHGQTFSNWSNVNVISYFKIDQELDNNDISTELTKLVRSNHSVQFEQDSAFFKLQALNKIHLDSEHGSYLGIYDLGNKKLVLIFTTIAIFILILAIINFINLHTASSEKVKKEMTIRKTLGASRKSLVKYFYIESLIVIFIAFDIAILLTELFLSRFNQLTGKHIILSDILEIKFLLLLIVLFILTWLLSGSYPALYLSSLSNFKSNFNSKLNINKQPKVIFRKALVILQFFVTAILIISFLTILKQVNYIQKKDLGFDDRNIMYFPLKGEFANNYDIIKRRLLQNNKILHIANQDYLWASLNNRTTGFKWEGKDPELHIEMHIPQVGFDYVEALNMKIIEGRSFNNEYASDSNAFIVNEAAIEKMALSNPIGTPLSIYTGSEWQHGNIIGVVQNINFKSLKTSIEPMVMRFLKKPGENTNYGVVLIKFKDGQEKYVAKLAESMWNDVNPNIPFEYELLDETYSKFYKNDQDMFKVITFFAILTILISCMGLFGLITFTIERREKEIGVRKAIGANAINVIILLIQDFLKLVFIGYLLALPVSFSFMNNWLKGFAYKIKIDVFICVYALLMILLVAILSIIYKSIRASQRNPVEILRYE